MITITKERVAEFIKNPLDNGLTRGEQMELARIALASLEAEPVAYIFKHPAGKLFWALTDESNKGQSDVMPVFAAPPAPVSMPDEVLARLENEANHVTAWHHMDEHSCKVNRRDLLTLVNACCAAMQGKADGNPELTVWYGAMPESNGKNNWTAILHHKGQHPWEGITIDRSEYPDRVRYEADRMRYLIGELADKPDILAYDADAHSGYSEPVSQPYKLRDGMESLRNSGIAIDAGKIQAERNIGNSPVIPDGWVMVPVEPTSEMLNSAWVSHGIYHASAYRTMIAAAPQQEVKS